MTRTAYEILALLERHVEESVALLKELTSCPGQRSDILIPLADELRYVRAQVGFEVTEQASDLEMTAAARWGRIHRRHEMSFKDPDDVYIDVEEREQLRKKKGLPPRVIILPWSHEEDEKLLAAKKLASRKRRRPSRHTADGPTTKEDARRP